MSILSAAFSCPKTGMEGCYGTQAVEIMRKFSEGELEARAGIEPTYKDLQTPA